MTGQVKEEIITRLGELGVRVTHGTVGFEPLLLRRNEFLAEATPWRILDLEGREEEVTLPAGSLGFTFCGVPVVYRLTEAAPTISVFDPTGSVTTAAGNRLEEAASRRLFQRAGGIQRIEVEVPESMLLPES